ncbi:MAG: alpha-galactosidase [Thermomicrobiales bacterium]
MIHIGRQRRSGDGPKIVIIGAGGVQFPLRLMGDMLSFRTLRRATFALMDVDLARAERVARDARAIAKRHLIRGVTIVATDDRRAALEGADYVFVTFMIGGLEVSRHDIEIPRRYGVEQIIGDTMGPGGIFRFLRNARVFDGLARDIRDVCPHALVLNYANPMAMSCWYLSALGVGTVGLCHSVQHTSRMLAKVAGVPYDDVTFIVGGINHQAWFTTFQREDEDLYPRLKAELARRNASPDAEEWVRTEIMQTFGYFHTESSLHASEYVPWFRKDARSIDMYGGRRWDHDWLAGHAAKAQGDRWLFRQLMVRLAPSEEYGARILHALEGGDPALVYANVPNRGLIANLPDGCCVEVACHVDRAGVQPIAFGMLPKQCAALNRTNVNVHDLAVRAVLEGDREHIQQAMALDPLTSAVCTLDQIRTMTDELLAVNERWLPDSTQICV